MCIEKEGNDKESVIVKPTEEGLAIIRELHPKGVICLCHRCRSILQIALTPEESKAKQMHMGVVCPKNRRHFMILIENRTFSSVMLEKSSGEGGQQSPSPQNDTK